MAKTRTRVTKTQRGNSGAGARGDVLNQKGIRAWSLTTIQDRITHALKATPDLDTNQAFFDGDHWQNGNGWVGPRPSLLDKLLQVLLGLIYQIFTSVNVVKEVVDRQTLGVVGVEPSFALVPLRAMKSDEKPSTDEQKLIDEAEAFLTPWWNERKIHKLVQKVMSRSILLERAVVRFYVPVGLMERKEINGVEGFVLPSAPPDQSIMNLWLEAPDVKKSAVVRDPMTMQEVGLVIYNQMRDDGSDGEEIIQLVFLDGDKTVLRTLSGGGDAGFETVLDLGKRLTMYQVEHPTFISEQVRQLQRSLNLATTCITRGLTNDNWLERVIMNAEPPGDWEYNQDGTAKPGTFKAKAYHTGPDTTNWLRGYELTDEETGKKTLTTPDIKWREPSGIDATVDARHELYSAILQSTDQTHVLLADAATASGRRVEQAREDHRQRLNVTRAAAEPLVAWIVMTALAIAEALAGTPGKYTKQLRCAASCRISLGPLTAEERKADSDAVDKSLMSRETAMERSGVVDVDAENARISADPGAQLAVKTKQTAIVVQATAAGASLHGAAEFAGIEGDELDQITEEPDFEIVQNEDGPNDPANLPPAGGAAGGA